MRVLVIEPERRPEVREIEDSLKAMQETVGGLIQCTEIFNLFTGAYYVDDVYGIQRETAHA